MAHLQEDDSFGEARFLEIVQGDRDLAIELAEIFLSELEPRMQEIQAAIRENDAKRLESAAHALKGSASSVSGKAVAQFALALERLGASGTTQGADVLAAQLESSGVVLRDRLNAFATKD